MVETNGMFEIKNSSALTFGSFVIKITDFDSLFVGVIGIECVVDVSR